MKLQTREKPQKRRIKVRAGTQNNFKRLLERLTISWRSGSVEVRDNAQAFYTYELATMTTISEPLFSGSDLPRSPSSPLVGEGQQGNTLVAKEIAERREYDLLHALVDSFYVWKEGATHEDTRLTQDIEEKRAFLWQLSPSTAARSSCLRSNIM